MTEPVPAKRHEGLFKDVKVPRTDNFNPDTPSGASWVRKLPQHNATSVEYLDHYYRQRLRALQAVDELVEKLVVQLDEAGVLDDTYIIYSSDNGFHLGQHRLPPGKECGYEEDIRVPLIVRGPGVPKGEVEDTVTTHIDLAPTILDIVGAEARPDFDGAPIPLRSSKNHVAEKGQLEGAKRHEHVAVEYWGFALAEGEGGGFGTSQLIRSGQLQEVTNPVLLQMARVIWSCSTTPTKLSESLVMITICTTPFGAIMITNFTTWM